VVSNGELTDTALKLQDYRARLAAIFKYLPSLAGRVDRELLMPIEVACLIGYPDPPSPREVERAKQLEQMMFDAGGQRRRVKLADSVNSYLRGYTDAQTKDVARAALSLADVWDAKAREAWPHEYPNLPSGIAEHCDASAGVTLHQCAEDLRALITTIGSAA
jgi:hypothetical protein